MYTVCFNISGQLVAVGKSNCHVEGPGSIPLIGKCVKSISGARRRDVTGILVELAWKNMYFRY